MNKLEACKKLGASILFVGDDWYNTEKWNSFQKELEAENIKVVYFPYTKGISSTILNKTLEEARNNQTDTNLSNK